MKNNSAYPDRRTFLRQTVLAGSASVIPASMLVSACAEKNEQEDEVSPAEDLMREHGLLNRILLIYDHCGARLSKDVHVSLNAISECASVIRQFIEDYHEKLEEDFLFPRFEKANELTELVTILRQQHQAGRNLTDRIAALCRSKTLIASEKDQLVSLLNTFNAMYRPHEAREDTVLFPALRKIVSKNEYDSLGEDFEKKEHSLFGEDGFATMVNRVAKIEKRLEIYDLSRFTPYLHHE